MRKTIFLLSGMIFFGFFVSEAFARTHDRARSFSVYSDIPISQTLKAYENPTDGDAPSLKSIHVSDRRVIGFMSPTFYTVNQYNVQDGAVQIFCGYITSAIDIRADDVLYEKSGTPKYSSMRFQAEFQAIEIGLLVLVSDSSFGASAGFIFGDGRAKERVLTSDTKSQDVDVLGLRLGLDYEVKWLSTDSVSVSIPIMYRSFGIMSKNIGVELREYSLGLQLNF